MNNKETRVFLYENDESSGIMLQEYLTTREYEAGPLTDREMGLEVFRQKKCDLCFIDTMVPKIGGFELAKEIRTLEPEIPIIFVTAKDQEEDVLAGFRLGADDYITRSFSM